MPTFVLNDESKTNSYGFRVKNAGIDLSRLKDNPVMLDFHFDSNTAVLGKWTNIRIEGSLLKADADFDMEDDNAKKIAGKVERGYIKGASLGIGFNKPDMVTAHDGVPDLIKSEAFEASICPIPSNAGALRLYAAPGQLLSEEQIKLTLSAIPTNQNPNQPTSHMKKMTLSLLALSALCYKEQPNDDEAGQARLSLDIEKLSNELSAEKTARLALQKSADDAATLAAESLVNDALKSGKITADKKDTFLSLAKSNLAQATEILGAIPAKTSLSAMVQPAAGAKLEAGREAWTYMDWAKKDSKGLAAMRANDPEAFAKLAAGPMKPIV